MTRLRLTFESNGDLFEVFFIAETLGKTVDHLLTGVEKPLSAFEAVYWRHYFKKKSAIEEEQMKKSQKSSKNNSDTPKMMGNR